MQSPASSTRAPTRRCCSLAAGWLLITAVALLALGASPLPAQSGVLAGEPPLLDLASYPKDRLGITTRDARHEFDIWIADTPERQRQGLMFVRDLPASQGMLFVNESPRVSTFWMKNTYIPLDMLFIDARGRIVAIFANTTPLSLEPVGPSAPVRAVLELRGGEAARRGIRKGDRLLHPLFNRH
ncbi:MAG: DUF192 domain-containing protein [Gammaproteobacteria bacterium]|nr:DUF192 domain-containing protein [Gammaproteobacteria bacterium]